MTLRCRHTWSLSKSGDGGDLLIKKAKWCSLSLVSYPGS
uniref:Uncharacterized protein n=1 Tax=Arundo donax TaxID=35708 RepID=A0A0A9BT39_ARUDO